MKMILIDNLDIFGEPMSNLTLNKIYECEYAYIIGKIPVGEYLFLESDDGLPYTVSNKKFISIEDYKIKLIKERYE